MRTSRAADCRSAARRLARSTAPNGTTEWSSESNSFDCCDRMSRQMVSSRLSTSASNHLFLLDKWFVRPLLALPDAWAQGPFEYMRILGRIGVPAEVAQLVEQWSEEPCVAGPIPALGTEPFCWGFFMPLPFMRPCGIGAFREKGCNG